MELPRAKGALAAWTEAASKEPVLKIAVQMWDAAIRYKETSDERVFLELPEEQRTLLRDLIDSVEGDAGRAGGLGPS